MIRHPIFLASLFATGLHAFSATNVQYLYGNFEGPTFLDTKEGPKHTITVEHYRTFDYGDMFMFFDYAYAPHELRYDDENDLYGEFSPRISINKIAGIPTSDGFVKEWYGSFQHNRGEEYRAWLYGAGVDLNIPGFSVFGLNLYRKIQNIGQDTYQLSANYYAPLGRQWHFEGFADWTTRDILTQNQLLFDLAPYMGIAQGKLEIGTEWHYYHENTYHTDNDVFQAMVKYSW